ncbi:MAG TPA: hypothetical protein VKV38_12120 [Trebonia sp.]|nr:hypothetical protein [Trebonia sp.]
MSALGPRGLTVLSVAGIAGVFLGVLGWTQRGTGLVAPVASPPAPVASPSAAPSVSVTAPPSGGASGPAAPSAAAGPLLSSEPYRSYAYQVWPGPLSADARLALAGFTLTVTRQPGGITVHAVQDGQVMTDASHFYPGGAKVYVLDSNLGDEGGSVDYNVTDDGLIVTNAQGQVLP